jgi:outer membrane protein assembly factor BamB
VNSRISLTRLFCQTLPLSAVLLMGAACNVYSQDASLSNRTGFLSHNVSHGQEATESKSVLRTEWTPEAVKWQAKVAGYGQSLPVIQDSVAFVTSVQGENKDNYSLEAFSTTTGKRIWEVSTKNSHPVASTPMVSRAAPSPVVDGHGVYAFYESGDMVAVSRDGKLLWQIDLQTMYGNFENEFGLSASPVQTLDSVIVLVDHDGPSYLVAINKADGKEKWRVDRGKRYRSWGSPGIVRVNGVEVVVCSSTGTIDGYDAATGKQLFTHDEVGGNTAATPIDLGRHQFLVSSLIRPADGPSEFALESNFLAEIIPADDQWKLEVKWIAKDARGSFCSPVASDKFCYFISPQGVLYCLDRSSGEEQYHERLACGMCWATPIVHGEHVYLFGKSGQTMTIKDSDRFEVVSADNRVWTEDDPTIATATGDAKAPEAIRERMRGGTQYGAVTIDSGFLIRRGDQLYFVE